MWMSLTQYRQQIKKCLHRFLSLEQPLSENACVQTLIEQLGLLEKRVAVEVNQELVVKPEWSARHLQAGDRVEIVTFVGGG